MAAPGYFPPRAGDANTSWMIEPRALHREAK
jgi:hypothetical protein